MSNRRSKKIDDIEEESAFVSMTDMTVSFLFIVMILLAFFANRFSQSDVIPMSEHIDIVTVKDNEIEQLRQEIEKLKSLDPLELYISKSSLTRLSILQRLRDDLKQAYPLLPVEVVPEEGTLRFQGEGLFSSNSYILTPDKAQIVAKIAQRLNAILPCYTYGSLSAWAEECNPSFSIVESILIEGHTDAQGDDIYNLNLSTNRATQTFTTMTNAAPTLSHHLNVRQQPVLSVAGYGEMRPVRLNDNAINMATNRRIDLRIIMYTPANALEVEKIREQFSGILSKGEYEPKPTN